MYDKIIISSFYIIAAIFYAKDLSKIGLVNIL